MNVERFTLDHYRALFGPEKINLGIVNQISGTAFALVEGKVVLAIGGVRSVGIGQAWAQLGPEAKGHTKSILEAAREVMTESIAAENLYRIYAEAPVDFPDWFKHLGFTRLGDKDHLYVR